MATDVRRCNGLNLVAAAHRTRSKVLARALLAHFDFFHDVLCGPRVLSLALLSQHTAHVDKVLVEEVHGDLFRVEHAVDERLHLALHTVKPLQPLPLGREQDFDGGDVDLFNGIEGHGEGEEILFDFERLLIFDVDVRALLNTTIEAHLKARVSGKYYMTTVLLTLPAI